jgi:hypothetical protein
MALFMREIGNLDMHMGKEGLSMQMEIPMRGNGLITKPMDKGSTLTKMEPSILENGKMIYKMVKALKFGLMGLNMMDITKEEKSMDTESTNGKTNLLIMGNGLKTKLMG